MKSRCAWNYLLLRCNKWIKIGAPESCAVLNGLLFKSSFSGLVGFIKDHLVLKHGQWSWNNESHSWQSHHPETVDWIGDEWLSLTKVQTLWTRPGLSPGVPPVAPLPPWLQPSAHERRPGLLAQHYDGWDNFLFCNKLYWIILFFANDDQILQTLEAY